VIRLGQKRCGACSPLWLHEIKHDGFRMLVRRDAAGVRLFTRNGHDWTGRFPLIARALSPKAASCLIDGEACCLR
jgi:bifunctional non-homologous end joining protein LigD